MRSFRSFFFSFFFFCIWAWVSVWIRFLECFSALRRSSSLSFTEFQKKRTKHDTKCAAHSSGDASSKIKFVLFRTQTQMDTILIYQFFAHDQIIHNFSNLTTLLLTVCFLRFLLQNGKFALNDYGSVIKHRTPYLNTNKFSANNLTKKKQLLINKQTVQHLQLDWFRMKSPITALVYRRYWKNDSVYARIHRVTKVHCLVSVRTMKRKKQTPNSNERWVCVLNFKSLGFRVNCGRFCAVSLTNTPICAPCKRNMYCI